MQTYIAILRGINVSGQKLIKMEALKAMMENLGFKNTITYIQSGNMVFQSKKSTTTVLEDTIKTSIQKHFSFDVPVLVKTGAEMEFVFNNNPFLEKGKEIDFLHVTFLSAAPDKDAIQKLIVPSGKDTLIVKDSVIYLYCPGGYGNTKLTNNFIEQKLKCTATTRNWKTIGKLVELAGSIRLK